MYIQSNKTNINKLCSLVPNRIQKCPSYAEDDAELLQNTAARAARLFFLVQPIRFLIHDVDVVVDVVDA